MHGIDIKIIIFDIDTGCFRAGKISPITHWIGTMLCPRNRVSPLLESNILARTYNQILLPRYSMIQHSHYIDRGNQFFTNTRISQKDVTIPKLK